tara:strand:- start:7929 stop:8627 length:699 start_codon:yes stop_codon:yes gene_type:complete
MKVWLTGGSGLLGGELLQEFAKRNIDCRAPSHNECNIQDLPSVINSIAEYKPNIVIHCAAIAKFKDVEKNPLIALQTNIIGTCNVTYACMAADVRLIFISTSHVFDGQKGNYKPSDPINPLTKYSKTKAAGEYTALTHNNSLVIRTEFCDRDFPFDTAYTDKWSSKLYVDELTPELVEVSLSTKVGVCHLGGDRKSFYDFAKQRKPNVQQGSVKKLIKNSKVPILIDTSLDF